MAPQPMKFNLRIHAELLQPLQVWLQFGKPSGAGLQYLLIVANLCLGEPQLFLQISVLLGR